VNNTPLLISPESGGVMLKFEHQWFLSPVRCIWSCTLPGSANGDALLTFADFAAAIESRLALAAEGPTCVVADSVAVTVVTARLAAI